MYSLTPAGGPSKYTISPDRGQLRTVRLPAGGPSKYATSSVAAQLGSAIDPASRVQPASLAVVIPMRWNVVWPSHVALRVMATGDSDAPAIRSHALARYVPPSAAPAASR